MSEAMTKAKLCAELKHDDPFKGMKKAVLQ